MRNIIYTLLLAFCCIGKAHGTIEYTSTTFNQTDGLSENTVSRIIQDRMGFVWIATWNGLNRYDGKGFRCFKAEPGKPCPLKGNRIDWIAENDEGNIWCLSGDHPYLFLRKEQRFVDVLRSRVDVPIALAQKRQQGIICFISRSGDMYMVKDVAPYPLIKKVKIAPHSEWRIRHRACTDHYEYTYFGGKLTYKDLLSKTHGAVKMPKGVTYVYDMARYDASRLVVATNQGVYFYESPTVCYPVKDWEAREVKGLCVDRQQNIWLSTYPGVTLLRPQRGITRPNKASAGTEEEFVRALCQDRQGNTWIADKNGMVRVVGSSGVTRYLSAAGKLQSSPCSFGSSVYCVYQDHAGNYWLGTKKDGLFRLTPQGDGAFAVKNYTAKPGGLNSQTVYSVLEDERHNLWIGTYGGGVNLLVNDGKGHERIYHANNQFKNYPHDCRKVRCLYYAGNGVMMAGTMGGLVTFSTRERHPHFYTNSRNEKLTSLPNNDVMQITRDRRGNLWLATLGGGISRISGGSLLSSSIRFDNVSVVDGLASDVCLTLQCDPQDNLWVVSEMALTKYTPANRKAVNFSIKEFGGGFVFSEVSPLLSSRRFVFGTTQGTLTLSPRQLGKSAYMPEVALVRVAVEGSERAEDYNHSDTLVLGKQERNVLLEFSTLDFNRTTSILYKYKVEGLDDYWQVSDNPSLSLMNLPPGQYTLKIMSTNGDGIWNSKVRTLTIVVEPKFSETIWAKILYSVLMILLGVAVIGIVRYIYGLRAQMEDFRLATNEKLEHFSTRIQEILGNKPTLDDLQTDVPDEIISQQQRFTDKLMEYMNKNIDNSELQVADIAAYMGMSKTLLYSKMKETLGCTPLNFINDLRIKRAIHLLGQSDYNVSSVAYACGFSDPHYFSRCFKKVTGSTPTEYMKNKNE